MHFVPGLGFWMVTRYDDVRRLFTDPERHQRPARLRALRRAARRARSCAGSPTTACSRCRPRSTRACAGWCRRRSRRARSRAWIARCRRWSSSSSRRVRGRRGVVDLMAEYHRPDPERGHQPRHGRRGAGRRGGALPAARAGRRSAASSRSPIRRRSSAAATRSPSSPSGCARSPTIAGARRARTSITDLVRARDRGDAMTRRRDRHPRRRA